MTEHEIPESNEPHTLGHASFHPSRGDGISIREYFAAMAMQGCLASGQPFDIDACTKLADRLIASLNKPVSQ